MEKHKRSVRVAKMSNATATLIQATVASSHQPKIALTQKLFDALTANNIEVQDFVWVVDSISKLSQWQPLEGGAMLPSYTKTPQFICRVDDSIWAPNHH